MTADPIGARLAELAGRGADGDIRFATAESCTGGQLAAALDGPSTLGPHLERGYIVYSVDAKCEMLGISRALAARWHGVGARVPAALHQAALDQRRAELPLAFTALCGPRTRRAGSDLGQPPQQQH